MVGDTGRKMGEESGDEFPKPFPLEDPGEGVALTWRKISMSNGIVEPDRSSQSRIVSGDDWGVVTRRIWLFGLKQRSESRPSGRITEGKNERARIKYADRYQADSSALLITGG
jgi:hypothetical protein